MRQPMHPKFARRNFISLAGKSLGLAALSSATIASLLHKVQAATRNIAHLSPAQAARDEDYWAIIQNSFTVTRGIVNLNNGGVSPSPRIVTEALVRYIWQQEDATAYTMWQILEPQCETIRTGLAELFGCDREEIAITRNASESLEILLNGMDFKPGDEILTTTQDYPRMLTTLRQRERRDQLHHRHAHCRGGRLFHQETAQTIGLGFEAFGFILLPAVDLDAQHLGLRIAAVACRAAAFFLCHGD